ncbi:hypothetical protein A9404_04120 [Halothiobacillus diazotrophicus]|uniref:Uncharacterized protein n=1 Tax=Halothiobacillus diazotrophicus TaxID=1860122 RepID=A0A191ZFM8_9GAMM|nr:hypothetical protein [Halothiobacillus diazotrophicus]ANJ66673.1 hypothetical protein A9404_04120 [Halothiobacillus diazotrophicus]
MEKQTEEILERIRVLQEELETEYRKSMDAFEQRRAELADEFLLQQRRYKTGLLRFLSRANPLVVLTAPIIYLGWIPFLLMDLFVTLYQAICFPVYRIPKVRRADYVVFGREHLPYLNFIEKFNCLYCSYGNGVAAYTREVASRTEQYWCPIKYDRRVRLPRDRYPNYFDYGDAEAYRQGLARLRRQYGSDDDLHPDHAPSPRTQAADTDSEDKS